MHGLTKLGIILLVTGIIAVIVTAIREEGGLHEVITSSVLRTVVIAALLIGGIVALIIGLRSGTTT